MRAHTRKMKFDVGEAIRFVGHPVGRQQSALQRSDRDDDFLTVAQLGDFTVRGGPLVAVLWGRDAATLRPALRDVPVVESAHPSPLSARRGFFGSKPFSTANALLEQQGATPVDWRLPA